MKAIKDTKKNMKSDRKTMEGNNAKIKITERSCETNMEKCIEIIIEYSSINRRKRRRDREEMTRKGNEKGQKEKKGKNGNVQAKK